MRWLLTPSIAVLDWAWGSTVSGGCAGLDALSLAAGRARARAEDCTIRPPGVTPPLSPPMARARELRGPGPEGSPPLCACPSGARLRQLGCLFIYFRCVLHVALATASSFPASVKHRCFQTLPGLRWLRGCAFCLRGGNPGCALSIQVLSAEMFPPYQYSSGLSFSTGKGNAHPSDFLVS